ncbi:MAG: thioredoxin family protein [Actinomycetota bacterium]
MVSVNSTMLPLGSELPAFKLADPSGRVVGSEDLAGAPATLVMFICNHCPYVKHIREQLAVVANDLQERGVAVVAINSNDYENYPDDAPELMAKESQEFGYRFPYLVDDSQEVARSFRAACTPDFFLFDAERKLAYRGQFDSARPKNDLPVTGQDLWAAAQAVLSGMPVAGPQRPSIGCNIKWKAGNAPDYFE